MSSEISDRKVSATIHVGKFLSRNNEQTIDGEIKRRLIVLIAALSVIMLLAAWHVSGHDMTRTLFCAGLATLAVVIAVYTFLGRFDNLMNRRDGFTKSEQDADNEIARVELVEYIEHKGTMQDAWRVHYKLKKLEYVTNMRFGVIAGLVAMLVLVVVAMA